MKPPLLINSVLPSKVYTIYSAEWKAITDFPADTAAQALEGARKEFGPVCRSAVIKNEITQEYARRTNTPGSSPGIPRRSGRARTRPSPGTPIPFPERIARGIAALGATISRATTPRRR